jgi:Asp-tRNA(Asn)/Glu-tRNA(Gln) amidotransferase A subunit family amidase
VGPLASSVAGCVELIRALVPGLTPADVASLEDLSVGVTWLDGADPLVRARIEQAAARFPRRREIELPFPDHAENALFMREAADVHRGLFPEHEDEYGEGVRWKLERCFQVTDGEVATALRRREEYRARCDELLDRLDLLVAPTIEFVAPPADADELELRSRGIRLTYPFDVLGWPALALPCGEAEDGLPASVQLVGRRGDDARVLAAGALLEAALA